MKIKNKLELSMIFLSVLAIVCSFVYTQNREVMTIKEEEDSNVLHDWETKFMIEDGYNGEFHYINEYKRNVDHSITFVGDDGLLWTIPYPYFYIHVNPHQK